MSRKLVEENIDNSPMYHSSINYNTSMQHKPFSYPKKVVIAYSKDHFIPGTGTKKGSAGAIASLLYDAVESVKGTSVTYIDSNLPRSWPQLKKVDLLITRDVYVPALRIFYKPRRTMIITVNQSRRSRLKKMKSISSYCQNEVRAIRRTTNYINKKCSYLVVGNTLTARTYIEEGLSVRNMREVGYGLTRDTPIQRHDASRRVLLCHIGEISFRKGIDFIAEVARLAAELNPNVKLVITGHSPIGFESEKVCAKLRQLDNVEFAGWVGTESKEFRELLDNTCAAIFPTREEGLAGSYLDVAKYGIPTFSTIEVGVEIPKQLTITEFNYSSAKKILTDINRNLEYLWDIAESHQKYLHGLVESEIPNIIKNYLCSGNSGPHVLLPVPVESKTKTNLETAIDPYSRDGSLYLEEFKLSNLQQNLTRRESQILRNHIELASRSKTFPLKILNLGVLSKTGQEEKFVESPPSCLELLEHSCFGFNDRFLFRVKFYLRGRCSTFRSYCFSLRPLATAYLSLLNNHIERR